MKLDEAAEVLARRGDERVFVDSVVYLAENFRSNLPRVAVASIMMGLVISLWTPWWQCLIWALSGVAAAITGEWLTRRALADLESGNGNAQRVFRAIALPRFAYVLVWSSMMFFAWTEGRPETFALSYLFVVGTTPQNVATSAPVPRLVLWETSPKLAIGILYPPIVWFLWRDADFNFYLALSIVAAFFTFYCIRLTRDLSNTYRIQLAQRYTAEDLKAQADEARRAKSSVLAIVSHELRSPINVITASCELLRETPRSNWPNCLRYIDQSADALLRTIDDTLELSAIEAGEIKLEKNISDLHELLVSISNMARNSNVKRDVELRLNIDPDTPRFIDIDEFRFRQAITNLLNNGTKFTSKGHVTLSARRANTVMSTGARSDLMLTVEDTGVGINAKFHSLIFQGYQQLEHQRSHGVGLGLALCKGIVMAMGGEIKVESEVNVGTIFTIHLPLKEHFK